jgi:imidazolonepropionase-like amidohydrolase
MKRRILKSYSIAASIILFLFAATLAFAANGEKSPRILALTDVRIINAKQEQPIEKGIIIIKGNIIEAIGKAKEIEIPEEAEVTSLKGKTVMPGLIDLHYHATLYHLGSPYETADEPDALVALRASKNLRITLEAGVTTVRDTGGVREITSSLKKALSMKLISGPRYYHSDKIITNTGGHGWKIAEQVDGKENIIRAIRNRFAEGAHKCDFIKITWNLPQGFSNEEIRTAIETVHNYGKKIAIHAFQPETIHACVEYGADTIEHGWGIDSETIPLAVKNKTIIVPTMYVVARPLFDKDFKYEGEDYDKFIEGKKQWWKMILEHLKPYVAAGGMIALGTDCGCYPMLYSNGPDELIIYKELGLTPFQIIQAGTINGAKAIGIEEKTGTLEKGKWADIIVLDGNPLEDLTALKRVKIVILDGEIVVDNR